MSPADFAALGACRAMNDGLDSLSTGTARVVHRRISDALREQILLGVIVPGTELPSTVELAARWKTSKSTAHTALNNLVKEGLLERHHGSATYVGEQRRTLACVGIYYDSPKIWADEERVFVRRLQGFLEEKLAKLGIRVAVFIDRRPERKQRPVMPEILKAISLKEIQGLIIPIANGYNLPALLRLPLPLSVMDGSPGISRRVVFDDKKYFRKILPRLTAKGCRSVGLISSTKTNWKDPDNADALGYAPDFLREAENLGLQVRKEWVRVPDKYVHEMARFGYAEFQSLWSLPKRPDAVIVFPDMVVRGVIAAALELGTHRDKNVTFCFHRNAHVDVLCPFPALWTIIDEAKAAEALIELVRLQHSGKPISAVRLSPGFEASGRTV